MEGSGKLELTRKPGRCDEGIRSSGPIAACEAGQRHWVSTRISIRTEISMSISRRGQFPRTAPLPVLAMATAMLSVLTDRKIKAGIAMTGEITLRGRVLPIGGLKEKTMAAKRYGIRTVLIPQDNVRDLEEIDQTVRAALRFVPVENVDQVFDEVFCREAEKKAEAIPAFLPGESGTEVAMRQ